MALNDNNTVGYNAVFSFNNISETVIRKKY